MNAGFALRKWYLDCVGAQGEVFIGYVAEARFGGRTLHYSSTLLQRGNEPSQMRSTLRRTRGPRLEGTRLRWEAPGLGVTVQHDGLAAPLRDTVLATQAGTVEWRCHMPRATAQITLPDGRSLVGLGYAEELTLTLPPWRLPIDELYWGRFLAEDASLVWIDWRGPHDRQVVFSDASPIAGASITNEGVSSQDGRLRLTLSDARVLREGALGRTVLGVLPRVGELLPVRILMTDERKWVARGVLERDGRVHRGWSIHEVVTWP